jgi:hypothetical protein
MTGFSETEVVDLQKQAEQFIKMIDNFLLNVELGEA